MVRCAPRSARRSCARSRSEEWSLLPGNAFTIGFLRTYAQALELDPRPLIDAFKRAVHEPTEHDYAPARRSHPREPRRNQRAEPRRMGRGTAIVLLVIALVVALAIVGLLSRNTGDKPPVPPPKHHSSGATGRAASTKSRARVTAAERLRLTAAVPKRR